VETPRTSGILLHPTSLPGPHGIGDFGPEAYRFVDWLADAGQTMWQVLPLGPTGYGESPYALFSAFAGNPLLLSLDALVSEGWLEPADLHHAPDFPLETVDFERVIPWKNGLLRKAFGNFRGALPNWPWLDEYATFMALKHANGGVGWRQWDAKKKADPDEIAFHRFLQSEFFRQWHDLKRYANDRGIRLMGDVPIYVSEDSADVWAHPELFRLDAVSGVPPDYFSATGQLWGNPLYRWDRMEQDDYRWWVERTRAGLEMFDLIRLDHFRGFQAFWEVPAGEKTAVNGKWVEGPGAKLFRALERQLGRIPLVAENLGVITPEVEAIREEFGFPGMAILQFAFGTDPQAPTFRPHNYVRNVVAYTGTHDNDTFLGWWNSQGGDSTRSTEDIEAEQARARSYFGARRCDETVKINWLAIRALLASVAATVLFPLQDILGLGSEARMNTPAVASGNWRWRAPEGACTPELAKRLREMVEIYDRAPY
jgi:4-alpha-glucanotransferase